MGIEVVVFAAHACQPAHGIAVAKHAVDHRFDHRLDRRGLQAAAITQLVEHRQHDRPGSTHDLGCLTQLGPQLNFVDSRHRGRAGYRVSGRQRQRIDCFGATRISRAQ